MMSAAEALARLKEGNLRFVSNESRTSLLDPSQRSALAAGQEPFAIILGCSDSRVPAELVFDQGFGDLFVIRVAGNIVAPSQVGSVEFAAGMYGTKLVVVMGHTRCGAIIATMERAASRLEWIDISKADLDFHREICRASGNDIVETLWETLARHVFIVFGHEIRDERDAPGMGPQHRLLRDLLAAGDVATLHREIERHIMRLRRS